MSDSAVTINSTMIGGILLTVILGVAGWYLSGINSTLKDHDKRNDELELAAFPFKGSSRGYQGHQEVLAGARPSSQGCSP